MSLPRSLDGTERRRIYADRARSRGQRRMKERKLQTMRRMAPLIQDEPKDIFWEAQTLDDIDYSSQICSCCAMQTRYEKLLKDHEMFELYVQTMLTRAYEQICEERKEDADTIALMDSSLRLKHRLLGAEPQSLKTESDTASFSVSNNASP